MKLLGNNYHASPIAASGSNNNNNSGGPAATRRPNKLPRDACVQFSSNPTELYVSMSITKIEHIEALIDILQTYAPQLEIARRRNEED